MTNPKEWEKEFEELKLSPYNPARGEIVVNIDAVKSFISSLLSRRDAEVVEMVESKKLKLLHQECVSGKKEMCEPCEDYKIYNDALDGILAALKDQTK